MKVLILVAVKLYLERLGARPNGLPYGLPDNKVCVNSIQKPLFLQIVEK